MKKLLIFLCTFALVFGAISSGALATPIDNSTITVTATSNNGPSWMPGETIDGTAGNNRWGFDMWLSANVPDLNVQETFIMWHLDGVYSLDSAHIWNYNQNHPSLGSFTNRGIQQLDIYVNTGSGWNLFAEDVIFARATGTPDYAGFDYDFGGVQAQYVMFFINSNYGSDGDGNFVGLSEIKFHGAPVPEPATMFLLGSGLIGVGLFVRRRFKK